jgi:peptide methionine sulfoxide reductase msrA/msrB
VITGTTGHAETVRIRFDPSKVTYEELARRFFEIHDPTQVDRQGPDHGNQYRSAVFVTGPDQRRVTRGLVSILEKKGLKIATQIADAEVFWPAEGYHQDYYVRTGKEPYCHARVSRF